MPRPPVVSISLSWLVAVNVAATGTGLPVHGEPGGARR